MSRGDIKTLERPDGTLPEVTYDKMATLLQEGKVPTSVLVAEAFFGERGDDIEKVTLLHSHTPPHSRRAARKLHVSGIHARKKAQKKVQMLKLVYCMRG